MKKFIISSEVLKTALKKLAQAVGKNPAIPALQNLYCRVRKNEVDLITSDVELTIIITCSCESASEFEVLIPFDYFRKVVALSVHQPLAIEVTGTQGRIIGENESYELGSLDKVKDFVQLPEIPKQKVIKHDGNFIQWIRKALATCGIDEKTPAVTMVCLDITESKVVMASTDKTMIFTHSFVTDTKETEQLLISAKVAKALEGFEDTEIYWRKSHIAFVSGQTTVIATRHEEKFPNYGGAFPTYEPNLLLERSKLIGALERACLNSDSLKTTILYLKKAEGSVHVESFDEKLNRKQLIDIPGRYEGPVEKIAVNAEKFLAMMHQVDYPDISLAIHEVRKPVVITAADDADYKSLIVPLSINE